VSQVEYILTETPIEHLDALPDGADLRLYATHAEYRVWIGDTFEAARLQWGFSVSRHSPKASTDYYITKIWRTEMSESGAFSLGTVEVDPRWEAE